AGRRREGADDHLLAGGVRGERGDEAGDDAGDGAPPGGHHGRLTHLRRRTGDTRPPCIIIRVVAGLVATFATDTSREKVVIGSLTAPPGRYQVHITAELKSGRKLTWHGNWITVK
ncbi:MAG: hypothetical protein ACKORY_13840, partial [Actinomycetota bacterium]